MKGDGENEQWERDQYVIFQRGAKHQAGGGLRRIKRLEESGAKKAMINYGRAEQDSEARGRVNPATPNASSEKAKIFRMLADQKGFRLPISCLLLQIRI